MNSVLVIIFVDLPTVFSRALLSNVILRSMRCVASEVSDGFGDA